MTSTFALGEEHNDFRAAVADFAARDLAPHVERWNAAHEMPLEAIKLMRNLGLFGLGGPEEYGGAGDFTSLCIAIEEIGKLDQSLAAESPLAARSSRRSCAGCLRIYRARGRV